MTQIFRMILSLSVSGGLVGLLILLFRPVTRRRFAKKWTYYLWLLVLVRLIVPVHVEANVMEYLSGRLATVVSQQEKAGGTSVMPSEIVENGYNRTALEETGENERNEIVSGEIAKNEAAGTLSATLFYNVASLIWILGVFLSAVWRLYAYRNFTKGIRTACVPVTNENVQAKSTEIQLRLRIGHRVPLFESTTVNSPMLIGLIRPYIILPSELLREMQGSENDICLILHHELVHYKRRDIWYKWLFQAVLCIHWFNPLLYWFNRKFNIDCELACDEMVMTLLTEEGRKAYGNILLNVAEKHFLDHVVTVHKNVPAMTLLEEKKTLKERLRGIVQYHKKGIIISICSVMVLVVLIVAAVICGVSGMPFHTDNMGLLSNETESLGLMERIGDGMHGNAYQMYDNDTLIAGDSESDVWQAHSYKGGGQSVECQKFRLNGSDELWIMYANKETTLEISSSFTLQGGRFKIVQVTPDGTVRVLNENGENTAEEITLPAGRNCFKVVGQGARLEDLTVSYSGVNTKDISSIYRSEEEEYGNRVIAGEEPLDMSRLGEEAYVYLEEEDVSKLCRLIWEEDVEISDAVWQDLFLYSDKKLTARYLLEALEDGGIKEFDSRILCMIAPYMEEKDVSECFRYLLEQGKVAKSDWEDIFVYSDANLSAEYLVQALRDGKRNGFSDKVLYQINYRVSVKSLTDIVMALDKEELSFTGLLENVLPFIQKQDEAVTCICYYIDLGNVLTDAQLQEIEGYVTEEEFYRIVEYNGKHK